MNFINLRVKTCILLLIFIGIIVYLNSLNSNFLGDDEDQIINNNLIHSISNIPKIFTGSTYYRSETNQSYGLYYRPVMLSVYSVIYSIIGADSLFYHLLQIGFHILNSILLFLIFHSFFPLTYSLFAALIFLVHPINNETVVYIANLQDILFMFFGLMSLFILRATRYRTVPGSREVTPYLILISIFLLLSLFSKETGILFIPVLIFYTFLFNRKNIKYITLWLLIAIVIYGIFRFGIAGASIINERFTPIGQSTLAERLLNTPKIFWTNLWLFLFPKDLVLNQVWLVKSVVSSDFYLPAIILVLVIIGWVYIAHKLKKRKKQSFSLYIFFSFWLFIGLISHSQIIPLDATFAERWFYFSFVGLLGVLAILFQLFLEKNKQYKKNIAVCLIIISLILSIRTVVRSFDWKDAETLYAHDLKISKKNYYLENSLASLYIRNGEFTKAKPLVESSIEQFSYFGNLNNKAVIFAHEKNFNQAQEYFEKAIVKKGNYMVYQNYANFLVFIKKDPKEAKKFIDVALKIYPESYKLWLVLGFAEYDTGNIDDALKAFGKAYELSQDESIKTIYASLKEKNILVRPKVEF